MVCFLYIACAALRLGRFNVQAASVESKHFQGLPVPMAALLICGMLVLWKGQDVSTIFVPVFINVRTQVLLLMFLVSLVMVSSIPYRNTKSLSLRQRLPFYYLLFAVLVPPVEVVGGSLIIAIKLFVPDHAVGVLVFVVGEKRVR